MIDLQVGILIFAEIKPIIICHHIILFICTGEISKLYRGYPFMYFAILSY